MSTPELLNKKHLNFGQGLEFLRFGQETRGLNQQNRRKSKETIRNKEGKREQIDKKFRVRDPYFLLKNCLFNILSVPIDKRNYQNKSSCCYLDGGFYNW